MRNLSQQLTQYASYHRDARNISTHFVGIPLIVLAIASLLSRPQWTVAGYPCSAAIVATAAVSVYYLWLDKGLGVAMTTLMGLATVVGQWSAGHETGVWLTMSLGAFVVGWIFQLVGHVYEGRKPAFVDDLIGLIIGPLFLLVEALFKLGALDSLRKDIEEHVGTARRGPTGMG